MARKTVPLEINDNDSVALLRMSTGSDAELALRARIVLACAESKQIKEIAKELGTVQSTVQKWKQAYLTSGIDGLQVVHAGGRPSSREINLQEEIMQLINNEDKEWTARELSEKLNVPISAVRYELRKNGINIERSRRWEYRSTDAICEWNPPVLGVHLSRSGGVIVTARLVSTTEGLTPQGVFETRNRLLIEEIEKSVFPLSLPGLLSTASTFPEDAVSGNSIDAEECISKAINGYPCPDGQEFHIFSYGVNPAIHDGRAAYCVTHHFEDIDEMLNCFLHWIASLSSSVQHAMAEDLINDIRQYQVNAMDKTIPFVWYLTLTACRQESNQPVLTIEATSVDSIEDVLNTLLKNKKPDNQSGYEVGAILYQRGNDGELTYRLVQSGQKFKSLDEFDYQSKEGFIRSISELEDDSIHFSHEIFDSNNELYLENVKKNKN